MWAVAIHQESESKRESDQSCSLSLFLSRADWVNCGGSCGVVVVVVWHHLQKCRMAILDAFKSMRLLVRDT